MKDHLKDFCRIHDIRIQYINNDKIVLAPIVKENIPIIKAHIYFANCPKLVAYAIFNYYFEKEDLQDYLKIIRNFIQPKLKKPNLKIIPPDEKFKKAIHKPKMVEKTKNITRERDSYELDISQITKKNFHGRVNRIKPNQSFKINKSQEIDLEIEVFDSNNYFD